jgi:hypothetical protein
MLLQIIKIGYNGYIMKEIIIVDDQKPEVIAMLQALYSRSPKSVKEHLNVVGKKGPEGFMSTYYVEYGHKSIGDCGTTTLFIENVCSWRKLFRIGRSIADKRRLLVILIWRLRKF